MRHRNAILAVVLLAGCSSTATDEPATTSPDAAVTATANVTSPTDPQNPVDTTVATDPGIGAVALVAGAGPIHINRPRACR